MASYENLDDIIAKLQQSELNKEENEVIVIPKEEFDSGKLAYVNSCYGKLFAERDYNIQGVKNVSSCAWDLSSIKIS